MSRPSTDTPIDSITQPTGIGGDGMSDAGRISRNAPVEPGAGNSVVEGAGGEVVLVVVLVVVVLVVPTGLAASTVVVVGRSGTVTVGTGPTTVVVTTPSARADGSAGRAHAEIVATATAPATNDLTATTPILAALHHRVLRDRYRAVGPEPAE
jgi:hypothetical protein